MSYIPRLKKLYKDEIISKMMEEYKYGSIMEVPKLVKIALNQGLGDATQDKKIIEESVNDLSVIAGQRVVPTKAKKSVSNFKLRAEMQIGARVTLRRDNMYEFLDRLISVALPRVKDFRGVNDKSFDGRGNYTIGIKEHTIFPEIQMDKVNRVMGMDITFVTTAKTDAEAYSLLKHFGIPFKN